MSLLVHAISDTHMHHWELEGGNILVHCGDATNSGTRTQVEKFAQWWQSQLTKYDQGIFVPGNHDGWMEFHENETRELLGSKTVMLVDEVFIYEGYRFYGSPWVPRIPTVTRWSYEFMSDHNGGITQAMQKFSLIPEGLDLLITHGPPWGILDEGFGSKVLLTQVERARPKNMVYGHIHEQSGHKMYKYNDGTVTQCFNVAVCSNHLNLKRKETEITLEHTDISAR